MNHNEISIDKVIERLNDTGITLADAMYYAFNEDHDFNSPLLYTIIPNEQYESEGFNRVWENRLARFMDFGEAIYCYGIYNGQTHPAVEEGNTVLYFDHIVNKNNKRVYYHLNADHERFE